jgi:hypothetical protein
MFPTISIFATIAFLFCDEISGEVSGQTPASSDFFLFHGRTVFCYMQLLPGAFILLRRCAFATDKSDRK